MTFYIGQGYIQQKGLWNNSVKSKMKGSFILIYIGIDVAKNKHDCCIINSDGEILKDAFTFSNSLHGFSQFYSAILDVVPEGNFEEVRVGLEATGHYSINLVAFIRSKGLNPIIFNPLSINLFRKAHTLRKTKTDKTDAHYIAFILMSSYSSPHAPISYHIDELKVLTRHRSRLVESRSKLKISISRLLDVIFPEIESIVWSIHQNSVYQLLLQLPNPKAICQCHLTKLANILRQGSKGKYGKDKAMELRELAFNSIGCNSPSMAFELQQTIRIIQNMQSEIDILDRQIKETVISLHTPLITIPGISFVLAAIILSEIGDILRFDTSAKLLAFAGLEPSTYESGNFKANKTPMVKRGSTYLRWALLNASRLVAMRDKTFGDYLRKKKLEGKHYNVAISHTAKKLVRVIFHMLKNNRVFVPQSL